ncbi:tetratricopeptide repeat protein [Bifidobacterium tissieri]|uniref:Tetratricopeptide repeat protein n=2 Tax=Bifidobacterium tissieri TaxID=1630162 RepID=A0A261FGQ0_9BIFI|nr:tetratricopeptide repeat protein [Bifidobacterium tissieri]
MNGMSTSSSNRRNHGRKRFRYGRLLHQALGELETMASRFVSGGNGANGGADPFEPSADTNINPNHPNSAPGVGPMHGVDGGVLRELASHARRIGPLVNRRLLTELPGLPDGLSVGWAQFPQSHGRGFSLAVFTDRNHCTPIAFVDNKGRVFAGPDINPDTQRDEPVFLFAKENEIHVTESRLEGTDRTCVTIGNDTMTVLQGGIVGRGDDGEMMWLASWLKSDNRYTLEQLRADLPAELRADLEYRDAMAIAFFAVYFLPRVNGFMIGFGSGNIFRRLRREAPIGAIRRSVKDTLQARAHGMRVSGLEDLFADLMNEAGALDQIEGLEAVHGAEPLRLYTSPYSGGYFFGWDSGLEFPAALASLRIEGNLNRFAAVSMWLERNARLGAYPTEDTVTRAQASQLDWALLTNPAITALDIEDAPGEQFDPIHDDGTAALAAMVEAAREAAVDTANESPDPVAATGTSGTSGTAVRASGVQNVHDANGSEWVYRQTFSSLVRRLRLPYRFDVEFRASLQDGNMAIGFTTAGTSMMPTTRYDERTRGWVDLSQSDRAALSTDYNLRVGLMLAALAFGADDHVERVSLHVDSIGLEEAVAEQNSAISSLMSEALHMFEDMRSGNTIGNATKADPKDGDVHGSAARQLTAPEAEVPTTTGDDHQSAGTDDESTETESDRPAVGEPDGDESVDRAFEDLMKGVDIDAVAFSMPQDEIGNVNGGDGDTASEDDIDLSGNPFNEGPIDGQDTRLSDDDIDSDDPIAALRKNPTVRNLVTVTFTRERFLTMIEEEGLARPQHLYRAFNATMDVDGDAGLRPIDAEFDLRDVMYSPTGAQEAPELSEQRFPEPVAKVLGAQDTLELSIQRVDVLQRAINHFHRLVLDDSLSSVERARQAMDVIRRIGDPELNEVAGDVTSAIIDGRDTPEPDFGLADQLDAERVKARDLLFGGETQKAVEVAEAAVDRLDNLFAAAGGVPRYFNSYAERVVYNRLFATPDEKTVLIPDNLFYAHMELADVLSQISGPDRALPHLNAMVAYAPAYPLSHLRLAIQLANTQDWDSARAACLNALRVALDRDDAAFAYYRLAYAEWMRDDFDIAAAAYLMSDHIASGTMGSIESELNELFARARSQCIPVPHTVDEAKAVLREHEMPVWPENEVASIVRDAARVSVDNALFVPARTLSMAAARMTDDNDGMNAIQIQFLRSLGA